MENIQRFLDLLFINRLLILTLLFAAVILLIPISYITAQVPDYSSSNTSASLMVSPKFNVLSITPEIEVTTYFSQTNTFSFNLSADYPGNTGLNITISREGDTASWISFISNNSINTSLLSDETKSIGFTITAPSNTSTGTYKANISALSDDSQLKVMNLSIILTAAVIWDNFKNNLTTNFSQLSEIQLGNVSNSTIGIPGNGLISFFNEVIDFRGADLDSYVNIGRNSININSTALPNLNQSAVLNLYSLTSANPIILRDGSACQEPICTRISYNSTNGTLIFNVSSFANFSASDCGNGVCDSGESYSICSADCSAPVTPATSGGGGRGGGGRPIVPVEELPTRYFKGAKFTRYPVIKEVVIGQAAANSIEVENLLKEPIILEFSTAGVPDEWISFKPETLAIEAGRKKEFTVFISLPEETKTGDYKVDIVAESDKTYTMDFFIIRVRRTISGYDKPIVTRFVEIEEEKTNVELNLQNPSQQTYHLVEIVESIPKDLAEHSNEVDFKTSPTRIIRADPIIQWDMLDVEAGKNRSILYSMGRIPTDFTHYIYWPLQQINIVSQTSYPKLKLVSLKIPMLSPGKSSFINLKIENVDANEHKFKFMMELPDGWDVEPARIEEIISAGREKEWTLKLSVPKGAGIGTYIARAYFYWDEEVAIKEYPVIVQIFPTMLIYLIIILLVLILLAYTASRIAKIRGNPLSTPVRKNE